MKGDKNNLSPAEDSDNTTEYETEEEEEVVAKPTMTIATPSDKGFNTDGELESAISTIVDTSDSSESSDSSDDEFRRPLIVSKINTMDDIANICEAAEDQKTRKNAEEEEAAEEQKRRKKAEEEEKKKAEEERKTAAEEEKKKTRVPKKTSVLAQARKVAADTNCTRPISHNTTYQSVFNRMVAAEKTQKATNAKYEALKRVDMKARQNHDDLVMQKEVNRNLNLQIDNLVTTNATNAKRLEFSSKLIEELEREVAEMRENEKKIKAEAIKREEERRREDIDRQLDEYQQIELHIPHRVGVVIDDIVAVDLEAEEFDCYENSTDGVQCLHLLLTRRGKNIKVRSRVRRKRFCKPSESMAGSGKRPRTE
jgi:hypothetical protein